MQKKILFSDLNVGDTFFDPNSGEFFIKVCGNAADFISGGDYFSGCFAEFEENEIVVIELE